MDFVWVLAGFFAAAMVVLPLCRFLVFFLGIPRYASKADLLAARHDLDAGGTFQRKIVRARGRQGYPWLMAVCLGGGRVYTMATLTRGKLGKNDRWTIVIRLGRLVVGELPREDIRWLFRGHLKEAGWPAAGITCPAVIAARYTDSYSVWLDLPKRPLDDTDSATLDPGAASGPDAIRVVELAHPDLGIAA